MRTAPAIGRSPCACSRTGPSGAPPTSMENGDKDWLVRMGLNADGALYKMYNTFTSAGDATSGAEKKTRKNEDNADLLALFNGDQPLGRGPAPVSLRQRGCRRGRQLPGRPHPDGGHRLLPQELLFLSRHRPQQRMADVAVGRGPELRARVDQLDDVLGPAPASPTRRCSSAATTACRTPSSTRPRCGRCICDASARSWMNCSSPAPGRATKAGPTPSPNPRPRAAEPAIQIVAAEGQHYEPRIDELAAQIAPDAALDNAKWNSNAWGNGSTAPNYPQPYAEAVAELRDSYLPERRRQLFNRLASGASRNPRPSARRHHRPDHRHGDRARPAATWTSSTSNC